MSRRCELTGTGVLFGNKVSHSQRKTRRRFEPNVKIVRFLSDVMCKTYKLKVTANCMRTVQKYGGFDSYMLRADDVGFSDVAKNIKKLIKLRTNSNADGTTRAKA